ncbi:MAG: histidine phosphatase family protein [Bryobacteraceae bacterium]|nr:histidine phosphatase family protein [Bryobacteraceae bacterium]
MELYLLRHGIAEEGHATQPDSTRALVPEGERRLRHVLKRAAGAGAAPSLILTSPYLRARQTAALARELLPGVRETLVTDALTPMGRPDEVWQELRVHRAEASVLLASHEPLCGQLTMLLLRCPALRIDFKKGMLVRIDFDSLGPVPHGTLRWILTAALAG